MLTHHVVIEGGRIALSTQTTVIHDEAALASTREQQQLLRAVEERGARLIEVGDPGQSLPVGAGGLWPRIERAAAENDSRVELSRVGEVLRMYCKALTGTNVSIQAAGALADKGVGWVSAERASTEGTSVFLPAVVEEALGAVILHEAWVVHRERFGHHATLDVGQHEGGGAHHPGFAVGIGAPGPGAHLPQPQRGQVPGERVEEQGEQHLHDPQCVGQDGLPPR